MKLTRFCELSNTKLLNFIQSLSGNSFLTETTKEKKMSKRMKGHKRKDPYQIIEL